MIKQKTTALKEKEQISVMNVKPGSYGKNKRSFFYQTLNLNNTNHKLNLNTSKRRDF